MDHAQLAIYPFLSIPQICSKRVLSAEHSAEHEEIKKAGRSGKHSHCHFTFNICLGLYDRPGVGSGSALYER